MNPVARMARAAADWVDLQYSGIISQLRQVAPQTHGRLLDVGCGSKPYLEIFRPYVTEYIGIERGDTFEHTASSTFNTGGPDIVYQSDRMPLDDDSFDTVLSVQVLEHTPEPQVLIKEMARVLKPGGLMILSVPFSFRLHEEPHDYFRYTPHGMRALCEAAGLTVLSVLPQGGFWSVIGHKMNTFLAFRVGHLQSFAQTLGKCGHEQTQRRRKIPWRAIMVAPALPVVAGMARVLDKAAPDETEMLSVMITLTKRGK